MRTSFVAAALLAATAAAQVGCGGKGGPPVEEPAVEVPDRSRTAADDLLDRLPAGADLVVEVDLERLRQNPTLGPLVSAWLSRGSLGVSGDILAEIDTIVVAVYDLVGGAPSYLSLLEGEGTAHLEHAHRFDDEGPLAAVAPPELLERIEAVRRGDAASVSGDVELMQVRTVAMPPAAGGASLRAAGRFGFDERVAIAGLLHLDAVPTAISIWGDVADDLAIVGVFGGGDTSEVGALVKVLSDLRDELAATRVLSALLLGYVVRAAEITEEGAAARAVLVVGPQRLSRIATRLVRRLEEQEEEQEEGAEREAGGAEARR